MFHTGHESTSYSAILFLRDRLLPNLFKEDVGDILYWAGKELARDYTLTSIEELCELMDQLSFGTLTLKEEKKKSYTFQLSGEIVYERLKANSEADFSLETAFVAQTIQMLFNQYTEGFYTLKLKNNSVCITLETDPKESIR